MQISSIVDIVEGNLVNSPSISFIYDIKTKLNKIHEGDLFIARNQSQIEEALNKGAFGVIYDFDTPITDNEIAWIRVKDTKSAITKLIRYKLINLNINAFYCSKTTFELLDIYAKSNNSPIKLIDNIFGDINLFEDMQNIKTIFCSDKNLLDNIYPNNKKFELKNYSINNLIEHSLFETTFSYGDMYFSRLKLPSLYINEFLNIYELHENNLDLNKLKKLNYFKPVFIDKYFEAIDYGHSNRFIISCVDYIIAKKEINHLREKYKYAKTIIIAPKNLSLEISADFYIDNLNEIKSLLKNVKFNALYIVGYNSEEIGFIIAKNNNKSLL